MLLIPQRAENGTERRRFRGSLQKGGRQRRQQSLDGCVRLIGGDIELFCEVFDGLPVLGVLHDLVKIEHQHSFPRPSGSQLIRLSGHPRRFGTRQGSYPAFGRLASLAATKCANAPSRPSRAPVENQSRHTNLVRCGAVCS